MNKTTEPANDDGRLFYITITRPDGTMHGYSARFVDSFEATSHAIIKAGPDAKVSVRPEIETAALHGKNRYPQALHPQASEAAWAGWHAAHERVMREAAGAAP